MKFSKVIYWRFENVVEFTVIVIVSSFLVNIPTSPKHRNIIYRAHSFILRLKLINGEILEFQTHICMFNIHT